MSYRSICSRMFACFSAAAAFAVAFASPSDAEALHRRYSAVFCMANGAVDPVILPQPPFPQGPIHGVRANGASALDLACPVVSDSHFDHTAVRFLNIHGKDNSTTDQITAQPCFSNFAADAGGCGPGGGTGVAATNNNAAVAIFNATTVFPGGSADFVYVFVHVPANNSHVRGYFTGS